MALQLWKAFPLGPYLIHKSTPFYTREVEISKIKNLKEAREPSHMAGNLVCSLYN